LPIKIKNELLVEFSPKTKNVLSTLKSST